MGLIAKSLGNKALFVTDQRVIQAGLVKVVQESLRSEGIHTHVHDRVEVEPRARIMNDCGAPRGT